MKRKTVYITAPRQVELREETLPGLGADEVLVETICSAISAGTEMLVYQGRFPRGIEPDSVISNLRGSFEYPLAYGYACVGVIRETGAQVDKSWRNTSVFGFQPHTSHFITTLDSLLLIPDSISPESASFLPNMETAVNLVQDGAPILGERVAVLGQGVVGLMTASLLKEFPLETLVTSDCHERRRNASVEIGVNHSFDPGIDNGKYSKNHSSDYAQNNFDLTFELTGSPSALNEAIELTAYSGRIVIGSWYGEKQASIDLGGTFHRSRIKLISSQVSTIAPELLGRWNKARRFGTAWKALERIKPEKWITHKYQVHDAGKAYELLDQNPQDAIQVIISYSL